LEADLHQYGIDWGDPYFTDVYWSGINNGAIRSGWWFSYITNDGGDTWEEIEPLHDFFRTEFFNPDHGISVNRNGEFYKTSNGGDSWEIVKSIEGGYTVDVTFRDEYTWAVLLSNGKCGITADGGDSWIESYAGTPNHINSRDGAICYSSDSDIWVSYEDSGTYISIYHSENGGLDFSYVDFTGFDPYDDDVSRLIMHNNSDGIIYGQGPIYYTEDGCQTWYESDSGSGLYNAVGFIDDLRGLAFRWMSLALRTEDGGKTWTSFSTGLPNGYPFCINFKSDSEYWVVGSDAGVGRTVNGGDTWEPIEIETSQYIDAENVIGELRGSTIRFPGTSGVMLPAPRTTPADRRAYCTWRRLCPNTILPAPSVSVVGRARKKVCWVAKPTPPKPSTGERIFAAFTIWI
jgi:photosystem II stability/assembly factor-like uncharacterized protein